MPAQDKTLYMQEVQQVMTDFAKLQDRMDALANDYFGRGYDAGGANPITDPEAQETVGVTNASSVGAAVTYFQDFEKFNTNDAVTTSNRVATLSDWRNDQ